MRTISMIVLKNFKRFRDIEIPVNPDINIFIGDNESGKSTLLQAIDLVSRGSRGKIEDIGLERLFNVDAISEFMDGERKIENLPEMFVELYFPEQSCEFLNGNYNSKTNMCDGIRLLCKPDDEFSQQIKEVLHQENATFPFEFYSVDFRTFGYQTYNGYSKQLKAIYIDNSQVGSPYSMNEYVRNIYYSRLTQQQRIETKQKYHAHKDKFRDEVLVNFDNPHDDYSFSIKNSSDNNIETEITLLAKNVPIENKGLGMQCFIKTELSINKTDDDIDSVLIEEPECHLSYMKMLKLIDIIKKTTNRQLFIATHSDLISTRLDLRKCILLNSQSTNYTSLNSIPENTAKFFMKAPDSNMLQFVLSKKVVLVEGDAEFILMDAMYKKVCNAELSASSIGVIAVDGRCFKRYLEIAKALKIKVAVITDNDGNYAENITNGYNGFMNGEYANIKIFADTDDARKTFEICFFQDNNNICNELFNAGRRTLTVQDYMLANKAEVAYRLVVEKSDSILVPEYIKNALEWINA